MTDEQREHMHHFLFDDQEFYEEDMINTIVLPEGWDKDLKPREWEFKS